MNLGRAIAQMTMNMGGYYEKRVHPRSAAYLIGASRPMTDAEMRQHNKAMSERNEARELRRRGLGADEWGGITLNPQKTMTVQDMES